MPRSPLEPHRCRERVLIALATVIAVTLIAGAALLVRDKILSNAREMGTQLAQSHAAEEQSNLSSLEFILGYGASSLDALVAQGESAELMRSRLKTYGDAVSEAFGGIDVVPYAVVGDQVIFTGDASDAPSTDPVPVRERPWYQAALAAGGEPAVTNTYADATTGETVFTVAKELSTPGDVLAIDVPTAQLGRLRTSAALPKNASYFLYDATGELITAVTDVDLSSPVSESYREGLRESILAGALEPETATYAGADGRTRSIFYAELGNGWLSVITIPTEQILMGGWDPTMVAVLAIFVALLGIICALLTYDRVRAARMRRASHALQILGNLYYAIFLIDYVRETYVTIKSAPDTSELIGSHGSYDHFREVMGQFVEEQTFERFKEGFSAENMRKLAQDGVTQFGGEYKRRVGDEYHWASIRTIAAPDLGEDEVIMCFRMVDEEVREQELNLELLQSSLEAAQQAARRKNVFFSNISHDMRTPLNAIIGMTRLLRENLDDPERAERYLSLVEDAGEQLTQLVNDVLDISHIESTEGGVLSLAPMDLGEVLERSAEPFRERAEAEGKSLQVDLGAEDRWVRGDARRIRQVMNNLISNALKYSTSGARVRVALEAEERDAKRLTRIYRIIVDDTGIGMSEEFLPHLFEPFAREEVFAPLGVTGTGLGMPIVKNLVQQMGGTITVKSAVGVGTTFTITIPFETVEAPEPEPARGDEKDQGLVAPAATATEPLHVLVAEDNEANTLIVCALLEALGADAVTTANGQEALEAFSSSPEGAFDAILMDMQMPVMDGCEATRAIRALDRPDAAAVPIIAVTANVFAEDLSRAREAGMDDHVTKPIDLGSLAQALDRARQRGRDSG